MTSPLLKGSVLKRTATGGASSLDSDYIQFNTSYADGQAEGRLQWNSEDGTLEVGMPGGNVNLQIGQEMVVRCRNNSGVTIANGDVVYISGTHAQASPEITLAKANTNALAQVIGMATEEILNNSFGYVTLFGLVRDVDTLGFTEGDPIYLSETVAGGYQQNRPTTDAGYAVEVGHVLKAHATEGVILCHINPYSPTELTGTTGWAHARYWDGVDYGWTTSPNFEGNVGINVTSPDALLHIVGSGGAQLASRTNFVAGANSYIIENADFNLNMEHGIGTGKYANWRAWRSGDTVAFGIHRWEESTGDYIIRTASVALGGPYDRWRCKSDGTILNGDDTYQAQVGINLTSPNSFGLHIQSAGSSVAATNNGSTFPLVIQKDDNVVLGIFTPTGYESRIQFGQIADNYGRMARISVPTATGDMIFETGGGLSTNSTQKVRIKANGDVWFTDSTSTPQPSLVLGPTAGGGTNGWRDITSEITVRGTGGTTPTWSQIGSTGFYAYKFAVNDECWMVFHIPHDIVPSSDIHLHAHWIPSGTNIATVKWEFEYAFAKGFDQEAFDLASLSTQAGTIYAEEAGPGVQYQHMVTESAAITLSSLTEPDGMLFVHVTRVTNGGTNNTDNIFLLTADVHYQTTNLATVDKAPNFYT